MLLGIDSGGTFTDFVVCDGDKVRWHKELSTPHDPAEAILRGIQDPSTLPDPEATPDGSLATPGLAQMIHAARCGHVHALHLLGDMAEQMTAAGGDMARLGGIMKRLVDGERDADRLTKGMDAQGASLVVSLLEELAKLEAH